MNFHFYKNQKKLREKKTASQVEKPHIIYLKNIKSLPGTPTLLSCAVPPICILHCAIHVTKVYKKLSIHQIILLFFLDLKKLLYICFVNVNKTNWWNLGFIEE